MQEKEKEIDLKELLKIIMTYKWSILFIMILSTLFVLIYLYFKPSIYRSSALIEVKSNPQSNIIGDAQTTLTTIIGKEKIDKEIEILKSFYINNHALNKVNFQTSYYIKNGFKKVEIYKKLPIIVKDIAIFEDKIIGKMIKVTPAENGYYLSIVQSLGKELSKKYNPFHNEENMLTLEHKKHDYNTTIVTPYFAFKLQKIHAFNEEKYIKLKGNNKKVFDSIISNLKVYQVTQTAPLINVEFEDNILERADEYVNTLIDTFIAKSVNDKGKKTEAMIKFIDGQLYQTKKTLNEYETKLEEYKISNNAVQPSLQGTTYINEISKINNEISEYTLKKKLTLEILNATKQKDVDTLATSLLKLDDQGTMLLIEKLQEVQIREEELRAKYSYLHPSIRPIKKQIYHIEKKIIKNIKNLNSRIAQKIESLKGLKKSYQTKLNSLPTKERRLVGLKRDYEVSAKIYDNLLKAKSEQQILRVAIQSDYRVIDYANNTKAIPVKPKRSFLILIGIILGFILGLIQAFIRNFFDNKISSRKELESLTKLPIFGIIPEVKKKNMKLEVFNAPKSPYAESFRSLRTNLQFSQNSGGAHVILVTSTIMSEGKSTTVANLGAIFNLAGYKCLIINLDMRKPTLHKYFQVSNHVGMSTYLGGKNSMDEVIQLSEYDNLHVITSGPIPPNPSELIMLPSMGELIDNLNDKYDYIFIDSAPLGLVTDTMNLMEYADQSLIVFREKYSLKSFPADLDALIDRHNLKSIGIILNGSDITSGSYGYGYGY